MNVQYLEVRTPLGKGKIVHTFPDGSFAVEYEFGGGEIRSPYDEEVVPINDKKPRYMMSNRFYPSESEPVILAFV